MSTSDTPTPRTDLIRDIYRGETELLCRALIPHANKLERELSTAQARVAELELKLTAVSDMAVADWNEEAVGICDSVVPDGLKYRDRLRVLFVDQPAKIAELEKDKARLDWLLFHPLTFPPVQIPCPDGRPGCLVYHCRAQTSSECRATIDAAMEAQP